jgi:hypothetical protein
VSEAEQLQMEILRRERFAQLPPIVADSVLFVGCEESVRAATVVIENIIVQGRRAVASMQDGRAVASMQDTRAVASMQGNAQGDVDMLHVTVTCTRETHVDVTTATSTHERGTDGHTYARMEAVSSRGTDGHTYARARMEAVSSERFAFGVPGVAQCTQLVCVGMDAEWKASTEKGQECPASILQVCV